MTKRSAPNRMTDSTSSLTERTARRIARQQKQLEKDLLLQKGPVTAGRPIRVQDLISLDPLTDTQADFFDAYDDDEATGYVLYGSAGTGKTWLSMWHAIRDVMNPQTPYKRIVLVRSAVPSRALGFLPGTEEEKLEVYERPYKSICADLFRRKDAYDKLKENGTIEFMSTSFLRGETFRDCIIVADEAQNMSWGEIGSTLMTRVGTDCKIIVCGDGLQDDLVQNRNDVSGFRDFVTVSRKMTEFRHFRFTSDDIVRSGFCKAWLVACEQLGL